MYTLTIGLTLLAACSDASDNELSNQPEEAQETEAINNIETEESSEEMAPASEEDLEQSEAVSEFTDYPELSSQDIFNPEAFDTRLVTDNPGTRVFIFRDAEQQVYKTVYIKSNNRLKVIDLANNELLLNKIIN